MCLQIWQKSHYIGRVLDTKNKTKFLLLNIFLFLFLFVQIFCDCLMARENEFIVCKQSTLSLTNRHCDRRREGRKNEMALALRYCRKRKQKTVFSSTTKVKTVSEKKVQQHETQETNKKTTRTLTMAISGHAGMLSRSHSLPLLFLLLLLLSHFYSLSHFCYLVCQNEEEEENIIGHDL